MSNRYQVKQTPLSEEDLDHIIGYIMSENVDAAENLFNHFEKGFEQLESQPFCGTIPDDAFLRLKGYRKLFIEPYVVFYRLNTITETVSIIRIFHMSMDYLDQL